MEGTGSESDQMLIGWEMKFGVDFFVRSKVIRNRGDRNPEIDHTYLRVYGSQSRCPLRSPAVAVKMSLLGHYVPPA